MAGASATAGRLGAQPVLPPITSETPAVLSGDLDSVLPGIDRSSLCPGAQRAYDSATRLNYDLQQELDVVNTASTALSEAKRNYLELTGLRLASLAGQIAILSVTVETNTVAITAALAATGEQAAIQAWRGLAGAIASASAQVTTDYRNGDFSAADHFINALGVANSAFSASYKTLTDSAFKAGSPLWSAVGVIISGGETVAALYDDYQKESQLEGSLSTAEDQAAYGYGKALNQIPAVLERLRKAMADCPPKTTTSTSATTTTTNQKPVSASFVYLDATAAPCGWGIGIVYGSAPGATSYDVSYYDSLDGTPTHIVTEAVATPTPPPSGRYYTGPHHQITVDKSEHFLGITGGNSSPPCQYSIDQTEGGRFKDAKALAILP
jgi:hypothetical protein